MVFEIAIVITINRLKITLIVLSFTLPFCVESYSEGLGETP